jgi:hypothetical protein
MWTWSKAGQKTGAPDSAARPAHQGEKAEQAKGDLPLMRLADIKSYIV